MIPGLVDGEVPGAGGHGGHRGGRQDVHLDLGAEIGEGGKALNC